MVSLPRGARWGNGHRTHRFSGRSRSVWGLLGLLLCALGGPSGGRLASAEDEAEKPKVPGAPLVLRRHDVSALTLGRADFTPDRGPAPVPSDMVNDNAYPLFGGEGEEPSKPYGGVEDVIELVKSALPPGTFEAEGTSLAGQGTGTIVARVPAAAQDAIQAYLETLTRQASVTVTVDVAAMRVGGAVEGEGGVPGAVSRGALRLLAAARATGFVNQRIVGRIGGQQAYVQDQDVEVAQDARVPDPIVGIIPDGLCFDARPLMATPERVRLELNAWLSAPGPIRTRKAVDEDPVETVEDEGRTASAVVELKPGVWTLVSSSGDLTFAVRASVRSLDVPATPVAASTAPVASAPPGPFVRRDYDVSDLVALIQNRRGKSLSLMPSNFTPGEPPELAEPQAPVSADSLVETVKASVEPESWAREAASIEYRKGRLLVGQDEARQAAVAAYLEGIRKTALVGWRLRLDVVSLPISSLPEWWTGLDDGAALLKGGTKELLSRPGARALDAGAVRVQSRQRNATFGGASHSYVSDYDVEIAEKSMIGNPIVRQALEGLSVDLEACPAIGGAALVCQARVGRSTWRGSREVWTRSGMLECPSLGRQVWNGGAVLPVGATRVVAAGADATTITLFLLTANAE